jgi:hypothetical protein
MATTETKKKQPTKAEISEILEALLQSNTELSQSNAELKERVALLEKRHEPETPIELELPDLSKLSDEERKMYESPLLNDAEFMVFCIKYVGFGIKNLSDAKSLVKQAFDIWNKREKVLKGKSTHFASNIFTVLPNFFQGDNRVEASEKVASTMITTILELEEQNNG